MSVVHRNLTGADLHEPKGADTALSGQIYVANGAGSGTWVDAASVITNSAWSTGDAKLTLKTVADTGWVLMNDGTIGDGSSGATTRANSDTSALFQLLWNNVSNTYAAVSGGRGVSAAADFAAHKTIALPAVLGRALVIAGTGTGLTARTLGQILGEESHILTAAEIPALSGFTNGSSTTASIWVANATTQAGSASFFSYSNNANISASSNGGARFDLSVSIPSLTANVNATGSFGQTHNNMQPSSCWNIMVKL